LPLLGRVAPLLLDDELELPLLPDDPELDGEYVRVGALDELLLLLLLPEKICLTVLLNPRPEFVLL
jgi:hypothetical protein